MSKSLPSVLLPARTWVDVYAETSIDTGVKIIIQNLSSSNVIVTESDSLPVTQDGYNIIFAGDFMVSDEEPIGVWVYSSGTAKIQVEAA
jgi:hypothetical protein